MGDQKAPNLEGVEGKLKNLKLSEAEKKSIKIGRKQACAPSVGKLQAVGKILSDKPARIDLIKKTLGSFWSPLSGVECKEMGKNRFLFSFSDEASKKKALCNGPWDYYGSLIVMENFKPSKTIDDYEFKTIPIWVRAYGIPMGMMNLEIGKLLGDQIGECLEVDADDEGEAMGEYLRIKVRMDITKPLMRITNLEIEEDEDEYNCMNAEEQKETEGKIISLKYEHLPDFCYRCGIIGHTERLCIATEGSEGRKQYGPWLRAIVFKGGPREEKSRSSDDRINLWLTNSEGSKGSKQGSDSPSWKESAHKDGNDGRSSVDEHKELISPRRESKVDSTNLERGNKLMMEEGSKAIVPGRNNVEENLAEREQEKQEKKTLPRVTTKGDKREALMKASVKGNHSYFRRYNRARTDTVQNKEEERQYDHKKRNVELMEIDYETGSMKKAKMEVDMEGVQLKEEVAVQQNQEKENAGLQRQPGETK